jgi:hypothetical protein
VTTGSWWEHGDDRRTELDDLRVRINRRPWTVNGQRNMNHFQIASLVKEWRGLAKEAAEMALEGTERPPWPVEVEVFVMLRGKRSQDCGAAYPAVKAAIDGLVDAGVIPDDTPEYLGSIIMNSPAFGMPEDAVVLFVRAER